MRKLLLILASAMTLTLPLAAAKKPVAKPPAKKAAKKTTAKASAKKAAPKKPVQQQPTPERYTEIEQALVDRGYLGNADGAWGAESIAALKKFQADQKLPTDGKLGALTLMAMGLGPRRGAFVVGPQVIARTMIAEE